MTRHWLQSQMLRIMRRNVLTYLFLCIALMQSMDAFSQVEKTKSEADQAFIDERYTDAILLYEEILSQEYVSAEIHYNLGNAYFKAGQIAPSILNYERALKPPRRMTIFNSILNWPI